MNKNYVNKNIESFEGSIAENLLNLKNDKEFYNSIDGGVSTVSIDRWKEAQEYEKKTWMEQGLFFKDDRNMDHAHMFKSYRILNKYIKDSNYNFIELGCGTFTNAIHIINSLKYKPDYITFVDPLLNDYLNHPNCTYKNNIQNGIPVQYISLPIEQLNINDMPQFDILTMINVIEHCYDVNVIFDTILKLIKPGGLFIFSDVYFSKNVVIELLDCTYNSGHPLKLVDEKLNDFLHNNFESLIETDVNGMYDQSWRSDKYFIGRKL